MLVKVSFSEISMLSFIKKKLRIIRLCAVGNYLLILDFVDRVVTTSYDRVTATGCLKLSGSKNLPEFPAQRSRWSTTTGWVMRAGAAERARGQ